MSEEQSSLKVIDDRAIIDMMANTRFKESFSFIQAAANSLRVESSEPKKGGCTCKQKGTKYKNVDFNAIKEQISRLPLEQRTTMKTLLNTKKARVLYQSGTGKRIAVTF